MPEQQDFSTQGLLDLIATTVNQNPFGFTDPLPEARSAAGEQQRIAELMAAASQSAKDSTQPTVTDAIPKIAALIGGIADLTSGNKARRRATPGRIGAFVAAEEQKRRQKKADSQQQFLTELRGLTAQSDVMARGSGIVQGATRESNYNRRATGEAATSVAGTAASIKANKDRIAAMTDDPKNKLMQRGIEILDMMEKKGITMADLSEPQRQILAATTGMKYTDPATLQAGIVSEVMKDANSLFSAAFKEAILSGDADMIDRVRQQMQAYVSDRLRMYGSSLLGGSDPNDFLPALPAPLFDGGYTGENSRSVQWPTAGPGNGATFQAGRASDVVAPFGEAADKIRQRRASGDKRAGGAASDLLLLLDALTRGMGTSQSEPIGAPPRLLDVYRGGQPAPYR